MSIEAVGADHQLDPVSCVELGQEAGDVSLRGPDADVELLGDLVVGVPGCHEGEHFTFAAGDFIGKGDRRTGQPRSPRLTNLSMRRRVTLGESSASPAATTRTAANRSAGGVSFTRNPLAPFRRAS